MDLCIKNAAKYRFDVAPNPMVAAIVYDENQDKIISMGVHKKYGENHAERNAILEAQDCDFSDKTLIVNLEPCSHHGNTPPCADLIIEKGFKKVVIGMFDPNPKVSGSGIMKLKNAGIEVVTGVLEDECKELNKVFAQNLHKGIAEGLYRDDINIDMLCVFFCSRHTTEIVSTIVKSANNENSQSVLDFFIEMLAHYIMTPQGWIYLQKNSLLQTYNRARRAFKVDKQKKKQKNNR